MVSVARYAGNYLFAEHRVDVFDRLREFVPAKTLNSIQIEPRFIDYRLRIFKSNGVYCGFS